MAETKEVKKPKYDFKRLTAEEMKNYIETYHNDAESKAAFKKVAFEEKVEQTAVTVYEADGKPKVYVDKNGKTRVKKKMIDVNGGKKVVRFNLLKAKNYFYDTYNKEIDFENLPKGKEKENEKNKMDTLFGEW